MKKIRKVIALVLVATVISCMLGGITNAGAATFFGIELGEEEDLVLGASYINNNNGVQCIYTPTSSVLLEPGEFTVTSDEPLAFDHVFDHWEDEYGNPYYAGDKIYTDKKMELSAVWVEKTDDDSHIMRVVKTSLQGLSKIFGLLFGIYEDYESFSISYQESKASEQAQQDEAQDTPAPVEQIEEPLSA